MKKILSLLLALTVVFAFTTVSCEKVKPKPDEQEQEQPDDPDNPEEPEEPQGPPTEVTHGGVTYKTVVLENGQVWLAENLRYIPEGKTPSADPADGNGLWYPTKVVDGAIVAATDEEDVAALGYLYDYETAFGATITEENFKTFEGTQGICPEGWHIPTRAEWLSLVGFSIKAADEDVAPELTDAFWYDETYKGAKITVANDDGFNFQFSGSIQKNTKVAVGKYTTTITNDANCSVAEYLNNPSLSMIMSSTGNAYVSDPTKENAQFFGVMSSFTKNWTEGKLSLSYSNVAAGYSVRCVWDQKADVTPIPVGE